MNNNSEQKSGGAAENKNFEETFDASDEETKNEAAENDSSLQALISEEQANARANKREELGREPTQKEVDEWLNAHTEGY